MIVEITRKPNYLILHKVGQSNETYLANVGIHGATFVFHGDQEMVEYYNDAIPSGRNLELLNAIADAAFIAFGKG